MTTAELRPTATPHLSAEARPARPRPSEVLFVTALVVLASAAQLLRQPGVPSWNSIWQEDGGIFLQQAIHQSFPHALFHVYNSYIHVGPRLVAEVVSWFPLAQAAKLISGGEAVVVSLLAVYVYYASGAVLRTQWARFVVAGAMVLLPAAGYETNTSISDMHWYLTFAAFWAILANPRTRSGIALAATVVALAVLSDPMTGVMLPLAAWLAWRDRRLRAAWVVPVVFVLTLALQLGIGFFAEPAGRYAPSHWSDLPGIYALRVTGSLIVGDHELGRLWLQPWGWVFAFGTLAIVLAVTAFGMRRAHTRWTQLLIAQCLVYSVLYLAVPCMLRGTANFLDRSNYSLNGSRYTVLPVLFLVALMAIVLERHASRRAQLLAAGIAAIAVLTSFGIGAVRSGGPAWKGQVAKARSECAARAHGAPAPPDTTLPSAVGGKPTPASWVRIPVSPFIPGVPQPFAVTLTCKQLAAR